MRKSVFFFLIFSGCVFTFHSGRMLEEGEWEIGVGAVGPSGFFISKGTGNGMDAGCEVVISHCGSLGEECETSGVPPSWKFYMRKRLFSMGSYEFIIGNELPYPPLLTLDFVADELEFTAKGGAVYGEHNECKFIFCLQGAYNVRIKGLGVKPFFIFYKTPKEDNPFYSGILTGVSFYIHGGER